MIPADLIAEWRAHTRWATDEQVEQDLVLSRALASIFEDAELAGSLALRGGTALHKLHFSPARRYSEDIDLVQLAPGPIGSTMDRLRARLDPWLGEPRRDQHQGVRLIYRFESETPPVVRLRLKVETNTREHFTVRGTTRRSFCVESRWWSGAADITTFGIEELLGTKLRARISRDVARMATARSWPSGTVESRTRWTLQGLPWRFLTVKTTAAFLGTVATVSKLHLLRLSSPLAAHATTECYPSQREVSHLGHGRVHRYNLFQVNDATICWIIRRSAQELPAPIVGIMGHHHDRRTREDRGSRQDAKAGILFEGGTHSAPFSRLQSRHNTWPLSGVPEPPFARAVE